MTPRGTRAAVGACAELTAAHPHVNPLQFCLHPAAATRSPAAQGTSQGTNLFILSENARRRDLPSQETPCHPCSGRMVAQELPEGSGHWEQLFRPAQLSPEDFCHPIFNWAFAELIFKPGLSRGAQPCQSDDVSTQYFHQPNLFSRAPVGN